MDTNNTENKPVRPNVKPGQKPVRPNVQSGQRPVRPNIQNGQRPVRPSVGTPANNSDKIKSESKPLVDANVNNTNIDDSFDINFDTAEATTTNTIENTANTINNSDKHGKRESKPKKEKVQKPKKEKESKPKKEKAPKKVKEPKQPKAPKPPKLDKDGNVIPENKLKKYGIIAGSIVGGVVLLIIIAKILSIDSDQHITLADKEPENVVEVASVSNDESNDNDGLNISMDSIKQQEKEEKENASYNSEEKVVGTSTDVKIAVGSVITIPVTVTTKLDGDKEDKNYYSYVTVRYDGMTSGYDSVRAEIDAHNSDTKHLVNVDDKETFFKKNEGSDLVMYSFTFDIPSDFPTNDTTNHKVYFSPSFGMVLEGAENADELVTDKYTFATPQLIPMTDDISLLHAGDSFKLHWIAAMPSGLDKSAYKLYFKYIIGEEGNQYNIESVTIPESSVVENSVTTSDDKGDKKESSDASSEKSDITSDDNTVSEPSKNATEQTEKEEDTSSDSGVLE